GVSIFFLKNTSIKVVYSIFYIKVFTRRQYKEGILMKFIKKRARGIILFILGIIILVNLFSNNTQLINIISILALLIAIIVTIIEKKYKTENGGKKKG
ncbi:hypothetical protein ACFUCO_20925, partial [Heyndrickxia sporothermodurans]